MSIKNQRFAYPTFIYNGKQLVIYPPSKFTINELRSRLHQMDVDFDQEKRVKSYFCELYERAVKDLNNRIKIIDKIIFDTEYFTQSLNLKRESILNRTQNSFNQATKIPVFSQSSFTDPTNLSNQRMQSSTQTDQHHPHKITIGARGRSGESSSDSMQNNQSYHNYSHVNDQSKLAANRYFPEDDGRNFVRGNKVPLGKIQEEERLERTQGQGQPYGGLHMNVEVERISEIPQNSIFSGLDRGTGGEQTVKFGYIPNQGSNGDGSRDEIRGQRQGNYERSGKIITPSFSQVNNFSQRNFGGEDNYKEDYGNNENLLIYPENLKDTLKKGSQRMEINDYGDDFDDGERRGNEGQVKQNRLINQNPNRTYDFIDTSNIPEQYNNKITRKSLDPRKSFRRQNALRLDERKEDDDALSVDSAVSKYSSFSEKINFVVEWGKKNKKTIGYYILPILICGILVTIVFYYSMKNGIGNIVNGTTDFVKDKIFLNIIDLIWDLLFGIFWKHLLYTLPLFLILAAFYFIKQKLAFKSKIAEIFDKIRKDLKEIKERKLREGGDDISLGLTTEQIIRRYSGEFGIEEGVFRRRYWKALEKRRRSHQRYIQANMRYDENGNTVEEWESREGEEEY